MFFLYLQKFIDDAAAMLQTPTTPDGEPWNFNQQVQSTPGVIGAQEVYRFVLSLQL